MTDRMTEGNEGGNDGASGLVGNPRFLHKIHKQNPHHPSFIHSNLRPAPFGRSKAQILIHSFRFIAPIYLLSFYSFYLGSS